MKKKHILLLALPLFLTSCGEQVPPTPTPNPPDPTPVETLEFKDVIFSDLTVSYDGNSHKLEAVKGAPEGTTITYSGFESYIDVGTYKASATLTKENYKTTTLYATLTINPIEYKDIIFNDLTVSYDGNSHKLEAVKGAPEGTVITYSGFESYIDVGTYKATATLTNKNYKTATFNATLTINPIDFKGFTYSDVTVSYDGQDHINDVQLVGIQPEETITKQVVKNSSGNIVSTAIDVGVYDYTVEITNKNYNKLTLSAKLTISAVKTDMPVFVSSDGNIYFSNGLHNKYIYKLDSTGETSLVDYSSPKEFNKYSPSKALFISSAPFISAVKEFDNGNTNVIYTAPNIDDFVKYNDTTYYYSTNNLFNSSKSGIYKVDVSSSSENNEEVVTKVFEGKTDNLAIYGGYLYFTNGNDNNYIYKLNLTNNTTSLVLSEKTHEFTISNNKLYCTVNGALNDYIGYIDLSSSSSTPTKLTNAAGEFLTIKNNKLYYNYTDLFGVIDTTKKGIWSIDLSNNSSTQELQIENVNGFDVDSSNSIVYTDTNDLHLYRYNTSTKTKTNLLKDFVAPETTPLNTGGKTIAYGNTIYYLNMYAGKTLYAYNELSKKSYQVTTNKVQDFYIYNDKLYFNQVTRLVNNDLYVVDLKLSSEAEKISTNDVRNLVSDGTYIYATHYNWAGAAGGISRMKLDGSDYVKFSDVNGAKNLEIKNDKLYFINCTTGQDNGDIEYYNLSDINTDSSKLEPNKMPSSCKIENVRQFIFEGEDTIYYIYQGLVYNFVARSSLTTLEEGTKLADSKCAPKEMFIQGDYIYYFSYPVTSLENAGLYRVNKNNAKKDTNIETILKCNDTYYCSSLSYTSNNIYFLNYIFSTNLPYGDAHTYQLNLNNKNVVKLD